LLKFEIVKCKKAFNEAFQEGELYKAYPNKRGQQQVFVGNERYLIRPERIFVISERAYYLDFFEPVGTLFLQNIKKCKELQDKTIDEILEIMKD